MALPSTTTSSSTVSTRGVRSVATRLQAVSKAKERELNEEKCSKEIDDTYEAANKDQAEYDKQLIALSGAFLAVTLAFIKDIVKVDTAVHRGLLYMSFVLLGVCVMSVLFSFQFSISGHAKARKYWEAKKDVESNALFPYYHARLVVVVNVICGLIFAAGVTCAILFVISNIHHEAQVSQRHNEEQSMKTNLPEGEKRGQNMKVPPSPKPSQPAQQQKKTK